MANSRAFFLISALSLLILSARSTGQETKPSDLDEIRLQRAKIPTDKSGLVEYLAKKTPNLARRLDLTSLIASLQSGKPEEAKAARMQLVEAGPLAANQLAMFLPQNANALDRELRRCIAEIQAAWDIRNTLLYQAAVRRALRFPDAPVASFLMKILPMAEGDELETEIWWALEDAVVAVPRVIEVFSDYVKDDFPVRRAAAGFFLCRYGQQAQRDKGGALLNDPDAQVRLRAAQALLGAGSARGIPVLCGLLESDRLPIAWQAEELLRWIAGDKSPKAFRGSGVGEGKQAREQWEKWWDESGKAVDIAPLLSKPGRPRLFLARSARHFPEGEFLFGADGTPRWRFPLNSAFVRIERFLDDERVLVSRITRHLPATKNTCDVWECSLGGTTLKTYPIYSASLVHLPHVVGRVLGGYTVAVSYRRVLIFSCTGDLVLQRTEDRRWTDPASLADIARGFRKGRLQYNLLDGAALKEIVELEPVSGDILWRQSTPSKDIEMAVATLLSNGNYACFGKGRCMEFDVSGKVLFAKEGRYTKLDSLRNGKLWALEFAANRYVEFTRAGDVLYEARLTGRWGGDDGELVFPLLELGLTDRP